MSETPTGYIPNYEAQPEFKAIQEERAKIAKQRKAVMVGVNAISKGDKPDEGQIQTLLDLEWELAQRETKLVDDLYPLIVGKPKAEATKQSPTPVVTERQRQQRRELYAKVMEHAATSIRPAKK